MFGSDGFRRYLRNTSWLFLERMVRLVVVLATGIYVARYLGDSLFGQLNYATGFVGLFFALTTMGLDEIIVRDLVKRPDKRDELLGTKQRGAAGHRRHRRRHDHAAPARSKRPDDDRRR